MYSLKEFFKGYSCSVVQVETTHEHKIKRDLDKLLESEDVTIVVPMLEKIMIVNSRKEVERGILFPGYILIFGKITNNVYTVVKNHSNVFTVLKADNEVYDMPQDEWELFGMVCNENGIAEMSVAEFDINDRIVIKSGALKNLAANIVKVNKRKQAAWVELVMFGEKRRIKLNYILIEKL